MLATAACSDAAREPSKTTVTYERVDALRLQAVDNDSAYMRRVYEHLGPERSGRPSDAAALGDALTAVLEPGVTALVKGSRVNRLERVVERLVVPLPATRLPAAGNGN